MTLRSIVVAACLGLVLASCTPGKYVPDLGRNEGCSDDDPISSSLESVSTLAEVVGDVDVEGNPNCPAISGDHVVFPTSLDGTRKTLYHLNLATGDITQILRTGGPATLFSTGSVSLEGDLAAFTIQNGASNVNSLFIYDLNAEELLDLSFGGLVSHTNIHVSNDQVVYRFITQEGCDVEPCSGVMLHDSTLRTSILLDISFAPLAFERGKLYGLSEDHSSEGHPGAITEWSRECVWGVDYMNLAVAALSASGREVLEHSETGMTVRYSGREYSVNLEVTVDVVAVRVSQ